MEQKKGAWGGKLERAPTYKLAKKQRGETLYMGGGERSSKQH